MIKINRNNNFDLVRLIASLQVVLFHSFEHLKVENDIIELLFTNFFNFFPGVPIFFFISGFLITASYERNRNEIFKYFKNRFLRIFPGLWACVLVSLFILLIEFNDSFTVLFTDFNLWIWFVTQISFFQFYTPDVLRFWGVGTPNGSLWTITVELQFYLILPLIFSLFYKLKMNKFLWTFFFLTFLILNYFITNITSENSFVKLINVSVIPYLYYFIIGIIIYKYWNFFFQFVKNRGVLFLTIYLCFMWIVHSYFNINATSYNVTNPLKVIADFLLAMVVFSFAFTRPTWSKTFLNGNDISYGVYIYHMLIINLFVHHKYTNNILVFLMVPFIVALIAFLSWKFIERPALKLK